MVPTVYNCTTLKRLILGKTVICFIHCRIVTSDGISAMLCISRGILWNWFLKWIVKQNSCILLVYLDMLHPGLVCRTFVPQAGKQLHASPLIHSRSTKYRLSRTERCYHQPVYNSRGTTSMNYRNLSFGRVQTLTATGRTTPTGVLRSLQAHQRRSIGGASQRAKIFKE